MASKTAKLSATTLKDILWDTMNGIKEGTVEPQQGGAIACQARQILQTVKIQLQIAAQTARNVPVDVVAFSEA